MIFYISVISNCNFGEEQHASADMYAKCQQTPVGTAASNDISFEYTKNITCAVKRYRFIAVERL